MRRPSRYLITRKNPDTGYAEFLGSFNDDTEKREWEDLEGAIRFKDIDLARHEASAYGGKVEPA